MIVTVIGAGTMGHGIAQVAAQAGFDVRLHDADAAALDRALATIEANLDGGVARGKLTAADKDAALGRIRADASLESAAAGAGLAIEAIVENLEAKQALFRRLESTGAVLASNTSSISIARIHPRAIGMHFFNPVHIMKLVEVVVHDGTPTASRTLVLDVARKMGKEPIVVRDSPGFASSRLGVVLGLEAIRMVEAGVASAEDIDKAMELGYKHPMGPLRLTDLVGLDVRLAIAETLHRELGGEQYRPPELLRRKVAAGELGKKSGRGFYDWTD